MHLTLLAEIPRFNLLFSPPALSANQHITTFNVQQKHYVYKIFQRAPLLYLIYNPVEGLQNHKYARHSLVIAHAKNLN
jgi:hypothetical protein